MEENMEKKAQENMQNLQEFTIEWGSKQVKEKKSKFDKILQEQEKNLDGRDKGIFMNKREKKLPTGDQKLKLKEVSESGSSQDLYQSVKYSEERAIDFDNYESESGVEDDPLEEEEKRHKLHRRNVIRKQKEKKKEKQKEKEREKEKEKEREKEKEKEKEKEREKKKQESEQIQEEEDKIDMF